MWEYINGETVVLGDTLLRGARGKDDSISIPAWIDGHAIRRIGSGAFSERTDDQGILTELTVPEGICEIASDAFVNDTDIGHLVLPESLSRAENFRSNWKILDVRRRMRREDYERLLADSLHFWDGRYLLASPHREIASLDQIYRDVNVCPVRYIERGMYRLYVEYAGESFQENTSRFSSRGPKCYGITEMLPLTKESGTDNSRIAGEDPDILHMPCEPSEVCRTEDVLGIGFCPIRGDYRKGDPRDRMRRQSYISRGIGEVIRRGAYRMQPVDAAAQKNHDDQIRCNGIKWFYENPDTLPGNPYDIKSAVSLGFFRKEETRFAGNDAVVHFCFYKAAVFWMGLTEVVYAGRQYFVAAQQHMLKDQSVAAWSIRDGESWIAADDIFQTEGFRGWVFDAQGKALRDAGQVEAILRKYHFLSLFS
ncbi:MAG: hypothetical protein IJ600_01770 [Lachnospiraceae bacterium]|nr:hypothetical protein [Lachnospiraceae bacterium]